VILIKSQPKGGRREERQFRPWSGPGGVTAGRARRRTCGALKFFRKWAKLFEDKQSKHTFASPFENWEMAYVSTNQDQITVIRSQFGG
jgi:hypothetical protein